MVTPRTQSTTARSQSTPIQIDRFKPRYEPWESARCNKINMPDTVLGLKRVKILSLVFIIKELYLIHSLQCECIKDIALLILKFDLGLLSHPCVP